MSKRSSVVDPVIPVLPLPAELAGVLSMSQPTARLEDMVIEPHLRARLDRVLLEQRQREKLRTHGLAPRRKILLVGPPGSGKTLTARTLACELSLPLVEVRLDGIITGFLGATAANLRKVWNEIARARAVYLLDEFDALGSDRASLNDVGEVRRVLNTLLVLLEQDTSDSVIVAATNHPELLDRALFRRFDDVLEYSLPDAASVDWLLRTALARMDTRRVDYAEVAVAAHGASHAEIARMCQDVAKDAILSDRAEVTTEALLLALGTLRISAARRTGPDAQEAQPRSTTRRRPSSGTRKRAAR
jgi:SpoVK/Ycf46/Vps4 family AAA+-type ATPase